MADQNTTVHSSAGEEVLRTTCGMLNDSVLVTLMEIIWGQIPQTRHNGTKLKIGQT